MHISLEHVEWPQDSYGCCKRLVGKVAAKWENLLDRGNLIWWTFSPWINLPLTGHPTFRYIEAYSVDQVEVTWLSRIQPFEPLWMQIRTPSVWSHALKSQLEEPFTYIALWSGWGNLVIPTFEVIVNESVHDKRHRQSQLHRSFANFDNLCTQGLFQVVDRDIKCAFASFQAFVRQCYEQQDTHDLNNLAIGKKSSYSPENRSIVNPKLISPGPAYVCIDVNFCNSARDKIRM